MTDFISEYQLMWSFKVGGVSAAAKVGVYGYSIFLPVVKYVESENA